MKFTIATSLLAAASAVAAAPTTLEARTTNPLTPSSSAQYTVWTGARTTSATGLVFKDGRTSDITTLQTFAFDGAYAGKTCQFGFRTDAAGTVTGSQQFDLFTSLKPAGADTTTWPDGNLRDQYRGRYYVPGPGKEASFQWGMGGSQSFPCPTEALGVELVGVYDTDKISWDASSSGLYVSWW